MQEIDDSCPKKNRSRAVALAHARAHARKSHYCVGNVHCILT